MNAWAFGTVVLVAAICVCGILVNNALDRWFRIRFHDAIERQQPRHRTQVIDVHTRQPRHPQGIPMAPSDAQNRPPAVAEGRFREMGGHRRVPQYPTNYVT